MTFVEISPYIEDGQRFRQLADDETGEIVLVPEGEDDLAHIIYRRHEAKRQADEWDRQRKIFDRFILEKAPAERGAYQDVTYAIRSRQQPALDKVGLVSSLLRRWDKGFRKSQAGLVALHEIMEVLLATSGISKDGKATLDAEIAALVDACTQYIPTASWVETKDVKRLAPEVRHATKEEIETAS